MYKTEDILQAARDIRPLLKELAGNEGEKIGQELDALLKQVQTGSKTGTDVLRLLTRNEKTAEWTEKFFENKGYSADGTRMFSELPGIPISEDEIYTCPGERDNCTFYDCECKKRKNWARMDGKDIPICRELNIPFKPIGKF